MGRDGAEPHDGVHAYPEAVMWQSLLGASSWTERSKSRTEDNIKADIEKARKEAGEVVDAAWLDRRAYCLTNLLLNLEKEIPVLELDLKSLNHIKSLGQLSNTVVASSAEFIMNAAFVRNRLDSYKKSLEEGNKELEQIKEKLKEYRFNQDKDEYEYELQLMALRRKQEKEAADPK